MAAPGSLSVPGAGVSAFVLSPCVDEQTAQRVSERFAGAFAVSRDGARAGRDGTAVLFNGSAMRALGDVFAIPGQAYIDVALDTHVADAARRPDKKDHAGMMTGAGTLCLSITTRTVYAHDVSGPVAARLAERLGVAGGRLDNLRLAVQEAIGNAALHGNLGLASPCRPDLSLFERHARKLEDALADPGLAGRAICLRAAWNTDALTVSVSDEGGGFDHAGLMDPAADAICGRGIPLMRQLSDGLAFADDGRTSIMSFAL